MNKLRLSLVAMTGAVALVGLSARGEHRVWKVASGDYGVDANWEPQGVPVYWHSAGVTNGGTVYITSGEYTVSTLGLYSPGSLPGVTNTVIQTGGLITVRANTLVGGPESGGYGNGAWYLSGGTLKVGDTTRSVCLGSGGNGYFEVSGTGVLDISDGYTHIVGWSNPEKRGTGLINLKAGGTIKIAQVSGGDGCIKLNHASNAHFFCDGGTIQLTGDAPRIFFGNNVPVDMKTGGLIVDTGDFSGEISYSLVGDESSGGLTKKGASMLTLSGANDYAGQTVVEAGVLVVKSSASLPGYDQLGRVVVKAGAALVPMQGDGWTDEARQALLANATVEEGGVIASEEKVFDVSEPTVDAATYAALSGVKRGAGSLTLTGHNSFGGKFSVEAGTLCADFGVGLGATDYLRLTGTQENPALLASPSGLITAPLGTTLGKCNIAFINGTYDGFTTMGQDLTVNLGGKGADARLNSWGLAPAQLVLNDYNQPHKVTIINRMTCYTGDGNAQMASLPIVVRDGVAELAGGFCTQEYPWGLNKSGDGRLVLTNDCWLTKLSVRQGSLTLRSGKVDISDSSYLLVGASESLALNGPAELIVDGATVTSMSERVLPGDDTIGNAVYGRIVVRRGSLTMAKANAAFAAGNGGHGFVEIGGADEPALVDCSNGYACILPNWGVHPKADATHGEFRVLTNGTVISKYGMYAKTTTREYATFILNGGTFRATGDCKDVSLTASGVGFLRNIKNVWMGDAGGTIDTQAHTLYAAQPIEVWPESADAAPTLANDMPALTKRGAGTLRLTGANTYPCATAVEEGTLTMNAGATIPATPLILGAAGTFDLGGTSQTVKSLVGSGTVKNGTLAVTDGIYPGGVGTVGTLTVDCALGQPEGTLAIDGDGTACDKLVVDGALDLSKLDLDVRCAGLDRASEPYVIVEATGDVTGSFRSETSDSRKWAVVVAGNRVSLVRRGFFMLVR